ncbi:hypothetical protein AOQ72_16835 [Bradyrhizobium yuanmingense]|uniref:Transposase InsH N-terminal domain-containing protein n=1 Tax=Bradyrhizobium yuanmingense TaxID=108015 RepID=A0A0R3CS00_9BRAD|nr:hypothetical protein AOQ72_16835 [Bradyrhizobium yuanmingense]
MFLKTMDKIVPWKELCPMVEPYFPKGGGGRPPIGLERMPRMLFVQHWFNLADEACKDALCDSSSLRSFVGIDLGRERAPDGMTLWRFRRLLEDHKHQAAMGIHEGALPRAAEERHARFTALAPRDIYLSRGLLLVRVRP